MLNALFAKPVIECVVTEPVRVCSRGALETLLPAETAGANSNPAIPALSAWPAL